MAIEQIIEFMKLHTLDTFETMSKNIHVLKNTTNVADIPIYAKVAITGMATCIGFMGGAVIYEYILPEKTKEGIKKGYDSIKDVLISYAKYHPR